jgi:hypothetical protein
MQLTEQRQQAETAVVRLQARLAADSNQLLAAKLPLPEHGDAEGSGGGTDAAPPPAAAGQGAAQTAAASNPFFAAPWGEAAPGEQQQERQQQHAAGSAGSEQPAAAEGGELGAKGARKLGDVNQREARRCVPLLAGSGWPASHPVLLPHLTALVRLPWHSGVGAVGAGAGGRRRRRCAAAGCLVS